mmetsp:Transcript_77852/g.166936  ORF Transcript_77852/g.166936 Transcript_77852/m.166936 type:complete len:210 (+) Transcript_77852:1653-2282(+)
MGHLHLVRILLQEGQRVLLPSLLKVKRHLPEGLELLLQLAYRQRTQVGLLPMLQHADHTLHQHSCEGLCVFSPRFLRIASSCAALSRTLRLAIARRRRRCLGSRCLRCTSRSRGCCGSGGLRFRGHGLGRRILLNQVAPVCPISIDQLLLGCVWRLGRLDARCRAVLEERHYVRDPLERRRKAALTNNKEALDGALMAKVLRVRVLQSV